MSSFRQSYLSKLLLHPGTASSISKISEARGKQEGWRKTKPEISLQLRESALIQSVESSNRIEGVEVEPNRLIPLITGRSKPKDRSEEELVGYRIALQWVHANHQKVKINSQSIKKLHKLAQSGLTGDAGQWKSKDNEIVEFSNAGDRKVRFKCTSAKETPKAIDLLCREYQFNQEKNTLPDLLLTANFILDFLCIHPFRDGNGRVSRLLTLLCLYQSGYEVGPYISLERIIENTKEDYYESLGKSSQSWHVSAHDLFPWWSYFLSHIKSAYQELKDKVDIVSTDSKTSLIRGLVNEQLTPFSVQDIMKMQPGLDREIIKKTLAQLKKEKIIVLSGKGRGARWLVK